MMAITSTICIIFLALITVFFSCVTSQLLQYHDNPTANLSSTWINDDKRRLSWSSDNSKIKIILLRRSLFDSDFACGFYCSGTCGSYLFAIFALQFVDRRSLSSIPQVVWSANRNNPVGMNSTLEITGGGDLVLRDADGTLAWSTNTAGKSVARLSLTEMGNLVLMDANSSVVWQSFDHPADCLLLGQTLKSGMSLTTQSGMYSVSMWEEGLVASIQSDHPLSYYRYWSNLKKWSKVESYAIFQNGSLDIYITSIELGKPDYSISIPKSNSAQYMKLGPDGHLRVFQNRLWEWTEVADIFTDYLGECRYPLSCGSYGICYNGQCRCPSVASFSPLSDRNRDQGCSQVVPLTCNAIENHRFLDMDNISYFAFKSDITTTDMKSCKEACLKNCSCKAAIFNNGACYMPSQIFSFRDYVWDAPTTYSVSIKVQNPAPAPAPNAVLWPVLGSILGGLFVITVIGATAFVYRRWKGRSTGVEEDYLDHVPGTPARFSFQELAVATDNFSLKLGKGGFGSVFQGLFNDGTRIAVKRLDGVVHVKKSFLAEVETIGSIHHVNLVRLIGFCAENSHRLLVYEYMCNGSLDRWIYCKSHEKLLEWNCRRKIILDIAKGLAYLHEDCRRKIIHLDIKPQNILLDQHYNAKVADFGLSKLIDKDQSKVVTTMRGTPGYLAPEWLKSAITEKADVYSFGVVVLEIVCGRKVFEQWRGEEERHLPTIFMKKAEEGMWLDLVDKCCQDVESNTAQVEEMMRVSALCLQNDDKKRPSMSTVIKMLEGVDNVQRDMDYNLLICEITEVGFEDATLLPPSILSGPR